MPPIKILYAEDYDLVLFTVKQLFELEGWSVEICRDGAACLLKLESDEHFDVIVLDTELPVIRGLELIPRLRSLAHREHTPVIIFSAADLETEARAVGAEMYLKKPGGIRDLIQSIEHLLYKRGEQFKSAC